MKASRLQTVCYKKPLDRYREAPVGAFFMFNSIPVFEQEFCYKQVTVTKKWKRLNRPPKIKTKAVDIPASYLLGNEAFGLKGGKQTVIAHPEIFKRLRGLCK